MIRITRYSTRNWALWLEGELLAVTVYKKGAMAVASALRQMNPALTLSDESKPKAKNAPSQPGGRRAVIFTP